MRRVMLPLLLWCLTAACSDDEGLPCSAPSFTVFIPAERAPDVAEVSVTGDLCSSNRIECIAETDDGDCLEWWITPTQSSGTAGQCEVDVTFECALPTESLTISWRRESGSDCDGVLEAVPGGHTLEGMTCAELAAGGSPGGAGAAGSAGTPTAAGAAGAAGSN